MRLLGFLLLLSCTLVIGWLQPLNDVSRLHYGGKVLPQRQHFAFQPTYSFTTRLYEEKENNSGGGGGGTFDFLSPYESKIPAEIKDEIYRAEANTPAAKDRGQRIAIYSVIAFVGVLCAFFNVFLGELRNGTGPDGVPGVDLETAGFGWVAGNFVTSFLFMNKIGGAICLLGGAGAGLLAEAEFDTKRINSEKIYEEMVRRRDAKSNKKTKNKASATSSGGSKKKKRRSGKESKRLSALSEVVLDDPSSPTPGQVPAAEDTKVDASADEDKPEKPIEGEKEEDKGVFGQIKNFYDKADSMAASQALLMNKKLEDAGVVEKITDESGLKVIGREEAAKLMEDQQQSESDGKDKTN